MTKEEKIQEAWGEYWEQFSSGIKSKALSNNGWLYYDDITDYRGTLVDCIDTERDIDLCRPKSLQGIEDNNGWIKIESEDDLPKDSFNYWIYQSDGIITSIRHYVENKKYYKINATHYQPIEKPKPPVY